MHACMHWHIHTHVQANLGLDTYAHNTPPHLLLQALWAGQQCVAMCCSVLRCVTVCCDVLQCVAVCCHTCTQYSTSFAAARVYGQVSSVLQCVLQCVGTYAHNTWVTCCSTVYARHRLQSCHSHPMSHVKHIECVMSNTCMSSSIFTYTCMSFCVCL